MSRNNEVQSNLHRYYGDNYEKAEDDHVIRDDVRGDYDHAEILGDYLICDE